MNKKRTEKIGLFDFGVVDVPFLILLFIILAFGLIMVFSASIPTSIDEYNGDGSYMFRKQLLYAVVGIVLMLVASQLDMRAVRYLSWIGYAISTVLLVVVLFINDPKYPGFHRWIRIGGFSVQPSEFMKFFLILVLAFIIEKYHSRIISRGKSNGKIAMAVSEKRRRKNKDTFIPASLYPIIICGFLISIPVLLVIKGNHNSGAILLMIIGVYMMFLGDFKKGWFVLAGVVIVGAVAALLILYKVNPEFVVSIDSKSRLIAWLDKDFSPGDKRWQINNALYAIGSGGFFGVGIGNSVQKYYYVSEPQNDMIFSIICEEIGFFGAAFILILFAMLVVRGVMIGIKAKDRFSSLAAMGCILQIGVQVVLNVAVATDLIPNTGISLPFFSHGGTSLVVLLVQMGIILAVSKHSRMLKK